MICSLIGCLFLSPTLSQQEAEQGEIDAVYGSENTGIDFTT